MQAQITTFIFLCVSSSTFSKPYEYSYYVSSPNHYQTLAVRDGEVINSGQPFSPQQPINPGFRHGRTYPGFNHQNPSIGRGYPGSSPSPPIGRRYPTGPNPNGYDFGYGQNYPNSINVPNGELDPIFTRDGRIPQGQNEIYNYQGRGLNDIDPAYNQFGSFQPSYRQPGYQEGPSQYGFGNQEFQSHHANIKRKAPESQEIDETTTAANIETTTLVMDGEKEEVTTKASCPFCGVAKVNPMDEIEGSNNPDSEAVEPRNNNNAKNFVIPSSIVPPSNVVVSAGYPGYPVNTPVIPYYVVV